MYKIVLLLALLNLGTQIPQANGQSYTTESKSCGKCGKDVSINSQVGMICPHCGVRWGYENESYSNYSMPSYPNFQNSTYSNVYNNYYSTTTRANLREMPTTKSRIITVIPAYSDLKLVFQTGMWAYVEYTDYSTYYNPITIQGYIHKSLIY